MNDNIWIIGYLVIGCIVAVGMLKLMTQAKDQDQFPVVFFAMMYIPLWGILLAILIIASPFVILHEYFVRQKENK